MTDQPTTAMGALRSLATTSTQIDVFSDQIIQSVQSGEVNPLEVLVQIRAFEKAADRIISELRQNFLTAAEKYEGTSFEFAGNKLEKAEAGTKYNYGATGDPVWESLDADVAIATERRKEREAFLRTIKAGDIVKAVDPSSGEEVTLKPAPKTSTSIIKVSIR
jgi:hypothetical protein